MNIQIRERPEAASSTGIKTAIADCDIHPARATKDELYPYLAKRWHAHLETFGIQANTVKKLGEDEDGQQWRVFPNEQISALPGLKLGICGEHGGDPASVYFCHKAGLDYVSCSPYRVPIARLAAAQAALGGSLKTE